MSLADLLSSRKTALTVAEVAELLNVSRRLVYQLVTVGEIPHFKVGSAVRFEPKSLSDWLGKKLWAYNKNARQERWAKPGLADIGYGPAAKDEPIAAVSSMAKRRSDTAFWKKVLLSQHR